MTSLNAFKPLAAGMMAALLTVGAPALAADGPPDITLQFNGLPGGLPLACAFPLQVDGWSGHGHYKEFKDKNDYVRSLFAGTGFEILYTNLDTGKTFSTKSNGAASHTTTYTPDGSSRSVLTGHNVVFMFATDIPAGPSTTLYVGRVVYSADANGVSTIESTSGRAFDICAALQ